MARMLFIVARDQPELMDLLRQDFAAEEAEGAIAIFMDRRQSPRVQAVRPSESDDPRRDQGRNMEVGSALRELGCAFVREQARTSPY